MLNPGLRRVWRSPTTVQFGVNVTNPVLLEAIDDAFAELLDGLDGGSDLDTIVERAVASGHDRSSVQQLIDDLVGAGIVIDGSTWPGGAALTPPGRARLAPDLAAAALADPGGPGASERSERLASTSLTIHGVSRLGAIIGTAASAGGFGQVELKDERPVRPADLCPGGFGPGDLGRPRSCAQDSVSSWRAAGASLPATRVVHVVTDGVEARSLCQQLTRTGAAHLIVGSSEAIGRVGPLVVPGKTPCLRCYDLARSDLDPQWPRVALQLANDTGLVADDSNLTLAVAGLAMLHLTSWVCGGQPPSMAGVVNVTAPHGEPSLQRSRFHPACGCTWPTSSGQDTMTG